MNPDIEELLEKLDVLSSWDDADYTKMEEPVITVMGKEAARINEAWLPCQLAIQEGV